MDLTLSGDIAKHLLTMTKRDKRLAHALAKHFLQRLDSGSIAAYLLTADVAMDLLARQIMQSPEKTITELQALPESAGSNKRIGRKNARKVARLSSRKTAAKGAAKVSGRRRKRRRLTTGQVKKLKEQVRAFLGQYPWSTRKQIANSVSFPSSSAYIRIMGEMKKAKEVQAQGEKSKTVYAIKGTAKAPVAKRAEKPTPRAKKKAPGSKRPAAAKKATAKRRPAPRKALSAKKPVKRSAAQQGSATAPSTEG